MKRLLLLVVLLVVSQLATAITPRQGLWYNPAESGRGYTIELQDNVMVIATFAYDASGAPMWYLSSGIYNFTTNTFTGEFAQEKSGQCFGCPYIKPVIATGPFAQIKIVFDSPASGTVVYPGGSSHIQPEFFAYQPATPEILRGEWAMDFQIIPGLFETDWPILLTKGVDSKGQAYMAGHINGNSANLCIAEYAASINQYAFLCTVAGYDDFYTLQGDDRHMTGLGWLTVSGGSLTGSGHVAYASKMASGTELQAVGISSAPTTPAVDMHRSMLYQSMQIQGEPSADALSSFTRLRQALADAKSATTH